MKIEFEKIIERANARKEALEKLQGLIADAEDRYADLMAVKKWVAEVRQVYLALDDEGRKLLPDKVRPALAGIDRTHCFLSNAAIEGTQGLFHLLPENEE